MILSENLILLGAIIFCLAIIAIISLLAKRETKIIIKTTEEERKKLEENFSAEIKKNTTATKNTELIELAVSVPQGFEWSLKSVDDIDGSEKEISLDGNNRTAFDVYKGRNMRFVVEATGKYATKEIEILHIS